MIFTNNYVDVSLMEEVLVIFYPALREPSGLRIYVWPLLQRAAHLIGKTHILSLSQECTSSLWTKY